jgi:hypothetical protein
MPPTRLSVRNLDNRPIGKTKVSTVSSGLEILESRSRRAIRVNPDEVIAVDHRFECLHGVRPQSCWSILAIIREASGRSRRNVHSGMMAEIMPRNEAESKDVPLGQLVVRGQLPEIVRCFRRSGPEE